MSMIRARPLTSIVLLIAGVWLAWNVRSFHLARIARDAAHAQAEAAGKAPLPGRAFAAADEASARAALSRWLGDRAVAAAVRISFAPLTATIPGQVRLKLTAKADEAGLRRFLRASEAPGLVSPGRWTLTPDGAGNLTLKGEIAANWRADGASPLPATPLPAPEAGRALFAAGSAVDIAPAAGDVPELVGIVGRLPDDATAILRGTGGTTRAYPRGGMADGWQVTAIAADRVTLTKAGRSHVAVLPPTSK